MNNDIKSYRKKILRDPLAVLLESCPATNQNTIKTLENLFQEYTDLKTHHKKLKNKSNEISRQIGQALKGDGTTADLKRTMKEHSVQINKLQKNLINTEKQILAFFISDSKSNQETSDHGIEPAHWKKTNIENSRDISVSLMEDGMDEEWDSYVRTHPAATIYHQVKWKQLIQQTHGHGGYYFIARNNHQKIVGILPMIHMKSRLFGNFMISMPYFNYGGAIADHLLIDNMLMSKAKLYAEKLGVSHMEYRDVIKREGLPVRNEKVSMILRLPEQSEELWTGFSAKLRSQIRRAQKEQTTIHCGKENYLDDFYNVFARNMRDLGTPVYGKRFFKNILHTFPEASQIIVIRLGGRPVAAGFLLGHRDVLEIPWASSIRDVNHLSINTLLYWEVLKFAIKNDYKMFDFGRSSIDAGTYRFKQQWGAKPKQLYWHYWLPDNVELPKLNPDNPKYALAINIWKKLPVYLTKWLGPLIVRNLP